MAVIVEATTDSRNSTAADVRHYFDKYGGNLGTTGCVSFMFIKQGIIVIEDDGSVSEDELMMHAVNAGTDDFSVEDGYFEINTLLESFSKVREYESTRVT